ETLERRRARRRDMGPDRLDHRRDLLSGESESLQDRRRLAQAIGQVVPRCQRSWIFRTMADEDPEIVHPRRRLDHVIIERLILGELRGQAIQPRLMAVLVRRLSLSANVVSDGLAVARDSGVSSRHAPYRAPMRDSACFAPAWPGSSASTRWNSRKPS